MLLYDRLLRWATTHRYTVEDATLLAHLRRRTALSSHCIAHKTGEGFVTNPSGTSVQVIGNRVQPFSDPGAALFHFHTEGFDRPKRGRGISEAEQRKRPRNFQQASASPPSSGLQRLEAAGRGEES